MMEALRVFASLSGVLNHNGMLAAVRKDGGDCIYTRIAYDGGVNVKVPLIIEDLEQAPCRIRAVAVLDLYSRWGAANYRNAIAEHRELYGDNVAEPETAQWACASAIAEDRIRVNRRVESDEIYRSPIDLELATDAAAIDIRRCGRHGVGDAKHKLVR